MLRNLLVTVSLVATCAATTLLIFLPDRPAVRAAPARPPLRLELSLLSQRETPEGSWRQLGPTEGRPLKQGDELQITIQVRAPAHLLVATAAGNTIQLLYPLPGQTGAIRKDWAYALPGPSKTYVMDGEPTRLLVAISRDPLPADRQGRVDMLRAVRRRPGQTVQGADAPPVQLHLRDGAPVSVPVMTFSSVRPVLLVDREL